MLCLLHFAKWISSRGQLVLYCIVLFYCCSLLLLSSFFFYFYKICLLPSRGRKMQKHDTLACFSSEKYLAFTRAAQLRAAGIQRPIKDPCRHRLENVCCTWTVLLLLIPPFPCQPRAFMHCKNEKHWWCPINYYWPINGERASSWPLFASSVFTMATHSFIHSTVTLYTHAQTASTAGLSKLSLIFSMHEMLSCSRSIASKNGLYERFCHPETITRGGGGGGGERERGRVGGREGAR